MTVLLEDFSVERSGLVGFKRFWGLLHPCYGFAVQDSGFGASTLQLLLVLPAYKPRSKTYPQG